MKNKAINNYAQGYSCSEAIVKAAAEQGIIEKDLIRLATAFSGGMSSGCVCGAVAGAQLVLSAIHGREDVCEPSETARLMARTFIDEFKKKRKATCCKVLSAKFDFSSPERKANCSDIVKECAEILEELTKKSSH